MTTTATVTDEMAVSMDTLENRYRYCLSSVSSLARRDRVCNRGRVESRKTRRSRDTRHKGDEHLLGRRIERSGSGFVIRPVRLMVKSNRCSSRLRDAKSCSAKSALQLVEKKSRSSVASTVLRSASVVSMRVGMYSCRRQRCKMIDAIV